MPPTEIPSAEVVEQTGARAPRRPPALSPSRANDFMQCPLLFRFRTVDRLPEPPSAAAARGTLVHAVLDKLYDRPLGERTLAAASEMVPGEWELLLASDERYTTLFAPGADPTQWLQSARELLAAYFDLEDPNRLQPAERELFVETQLENGPLLRGIVDRLDVTSDGAVRVVDYKTGKSPRPGYESNAAFQMRFYALVLWRARGMIPRMLQLVYLGDSKILRAEPTESDLVNTEQRVRALWAAITSAASTGEWATRRGPLCNWCAHQSLCPEFGGTPPELTAGAAQRALGLATTTAARP